MGNGLPDDWFIEETGERLILDQQKVAAEIERLRGVLEAIATNRIGCVVGKDELPEAANFRAARNIAKEAIGLKD